VNINDINNYLIQVGQQCILKLSITASIVLHVRICDSLLCATITCSACHVQHACDILSNHLLLCGQRGVNEMMQYRLSEHFNYPNAKSNYSIRVFWYWCRAF